MTSAYLDAITAVMSAHPYFNMTHEQVAQSVQFRALDIEIGRAETDLGCRETAGDWPDYRLCDCEHGGGTTHRHYKRRSGETRLPLFATEFDFGDNE